MNSGLGSIRDGVSSNDVQVTPGASRRPPQAKLPGMSADPKVRKKKYGRHGPSLVCYKEAQRQNNYITCVSS